MAVTGAKNGSNTIRIQCAGVAANCTIAAGGPAAPSFAITAPAAMAGTITGGAITLGASATFAGSEKVAVYWTVAGVNFYRYDVTIASGTGTSFALSGGTGTALPSGAQGVSLAVNQDVTDDVSLTGNNVQQLLVTSTQPGLVEWLNATPAQDRLSYLPAAGPYETWPSGPAQSGPPSGGAARAGPAATLSSRSVSGISVRCRRPCRSA